MIGLIVNDLYLTVKNCRVYFIFTAVFVVCTFVERLNFIDAVISFYIIYSYLLIAMIPMTLYALDERDRWLAYSMTLPVSRQEYVSGKYIIGILFTAFNTVVWLITRIAATINAAHVIPGQEPIPLSSVLALSLLVPALSLPAAFKFGSAKSRVVTIFFIVACAVIVANLSSSGFSIKIDDGLLTALMYILPLLLFAASWVLSVRIYNKKEL